jgi:hypothetical protein
MANNKTIFQRLGTVLRGHSGNNDALERAGLLNAKPSEEILFQTTDKAAYERELRALSQEKLLAMQWIKAGMEDADKRIQAKSEMHMLYFDCDLMDADSEIHAALDIMSEEACTIGSTGKLLNVTSSSDRIKSILEDLFVNRLSINTTLPMITRGMCKYGNDYMLLNINKDNGILGWRELPVAKMERLENGSTTPGGYSMGVNLIDLKSVLDSCKNEHITMNCGNKKSIIINRGTISNVIAETRTK